MFSKIFSLAKTKFTSNLSQKPSKSSSNNKNYQNRNMQSQSYKDLFSVSRHQNGTLEVKLNRKYQIKVDDPYYETIEFILPLINEKNNSDKTHIKQKFGLNYFSSIQFQLGKDKMEEQKCTICLEEFTVKNIEKQLAEQTLEDIYTLPCSHKYHMGCLKDLIGQKNWAKCPICSTIFGQMTGDQPEGKMTVNVNKNMTLPGHQKGAITINYYMQGGTRKGLHFAGTSRTAYLPNSKQGKEVLELLQQAFRRKLIFTVGRSVTTGLDNQTVWNGIHHKTSTSGGASHFGYPDSTYLTRVKQELAAKGVTLESLKNRHYHHK